MEPSPSASGSGEGPPSPAPTGDGGGAGGGNGTGGESSSSGNKDPPPPPPPPRQLPLSRYESQKRRDWNTFLQYLKNHKPPLSLSRSGGTHVIEFLNYLDQFGKTKVHSTACAYFGHPNPPATCACPLRQAWGSLDALIGRLRAAYEENGGRPESNPFGARAVRIFLREVKESQAKARGKPYEKKKRKRFPPNPNSASSIPTASETAGNEPSSSSTSTACASATANSSSAIVGEVAAAAAAATGGGDSGSGAARLEGSVSLLSGSS